MSSDVFTTAERAAVMRRVPSRNTGPELKLRKILTRLGARYRLHRKDLPGSPDVAIIAKRTAIFMHGCFWHGHDCKRGARVPKTNRDYWEAKIARNRARDAANGEALLARSWTPITVWECELKDQDALEAKLRTLLGHRPVEPNPLAPLWVSSSVSTSAKDDWTTGETII